MDGRTTTPSTASWLRAALAQQNKKKSLRCLAISKNILEHIMETSSSVRHTTIHALRWATFIYKHSVEIMALPRRTRLKHGNTRLATLLSVAFYSTRYRNLERLILMMGC